MRAVRLNPLVAAGWRVQRWILRASRARLGAGMGAFRVLLLETTGRASGRRRSVGLSHLEDGGPFCVVGSYSGEERDPAWALNLRAEPRAVVTTRRRTVPVAARELDGEERDRIFERFVALDPSYAGPVPHVADDPGVRAAAGAALTRCRR